MRKKKNDAATTQKPRTTLLQEGEIDVRIPTLNAAASESKVNDADPNNSHVVFGSLSNYIQIFTNTRGNG